MDFKRYVAAALAMACMSGSAAHAQQSLTVDAISINGMTEGRAQAVTEFNGKYLTVRPGTSLMDTPHICYPDSTYYGANTLDDNILPLAFGFVPEDVKGQVVGNVIAELRKARFHCKVSEEVEPYVLPVLSESGQSSVAYYITQKHPDRVTDDWIRPEYVQKWKEQYLAGIKYGKRRINITPDLTIDEMDSLSVTSATPWGEVRCRIVKDMMHAEMDITVPHRARVTLPSGTRRMRRGTKHFSVSLNLPESDFELPESGKGHARAVEEQFIYHDAGFPQCHSSTICFAENGDLLAAFYGGTAEHEPDTKVRLCRKAAGSGEWTGPVTVAEPDKDRYCLDNPVLFRIPEPGEPMLLFYKIRPGYNIKEGVIDLRTIAFWEGRLKKSYDDGLTWSEAEALPEGYLGPIKDKPIYRGGRLICGSSFEPKYNHLSTSIHFEWTDDKGASWHCVKPDSVQLSIPASRRKAGRAGENFDVPADPDYYYGNWQPIHSIQPTILVHKDGSLQALCRTGNSRMSTTWSRDNGQTWSEEVLTDIPQNGSGIDATTLPDGRFAMVYNNVETLPGAKSAPRTPLVLALSDDGLHWTDVLTLESDPVKEYSYPAVICDSQGNLHITYTWRRYCIKYVMVELK